MSTKHEKDTCETWECPYCYKISPSAMFQPIGDVEGLLCPHCLKRYAFTRDTIGKVQCPACDGWDFIGHFACKHLNRRGDNIYTCPMCGAQSFSLGRN